ncbi:MAG: ACT domain-containing protein [Actinobacteria bacterium]|nr:ACT domain-containing protein [Actinomycetota bacterium]
MTGETDLGRMLATLRVERLADPVTVVTLPEPVELGDGVLALVTEAEGTTAVVTVDEADRRGWPIGFRAAWLTLAVHSSLAAVGLTAAVSTALADRGIACNVLAGFHHDHLLVPLDRADDAVAAIEGLARRVRG